MLAWVATGASLEGQSQPTSISFSPGTVQQGECYTTRAGSGANMTLDLRYRFNGGSTQTITGWPTLNSSGEYSACTSSSNPVGTYVFTGYKNTLASSWISTSKTVRVTAPPTPDFSLSVSPSSGNVNQGASRTYTVTLSRVNGFSSSVSLSLSGLRSGNTGSFSPNAISTSTSTLTIRASTTGTTGSDSFTVTGTGGGLTRSQSATVTVNPPPPPTHLSVSPLSGDVAQSSSRTYTVTLNPSGVFSGALTLSVSGLGTGLTGSFSPTSISSAAPTSTLTIAASATAALGSDAFTIRGSTGPYERLRASATVTVNPPPPPTHLSVSPLSGDVAQSSSRTYTVTLSPAAGFTSSVALSVSGLGTGLSGSFSSTSVSSSAPASTLTITASATAALGSDAFTIRGTGGGLTLTATATVVVFDSQHPQPTSMSLSSTSGFAGNDCFTTTVGNGANMNVVLKYKRNGVWQPEITITMDADGEYENCLGHDDSGIYTFHAIRNALNTSFFNLPSVLTYTIKPPQPTSLALSPSPIRAGSGSYTMTVGNGADVTLDLEYTLNGGTTQTITGWPSLEPISEGSSTGQVDIDTGPCTAVGSYVFTRIRNTLNIPWVSVNAPIEVTVPPPPVVTNVLPSSDDRGTTVDVTFTGSNLCAISLLSSVSGITFSEVTYDNVTGTTASARFHVASSTPVGRAIITLTATGGSTTFNFQITDPPLTRLLISPLSGDVAQGSSRDYTVTLSPAAGFTSSVALSVSGLGTGLSGSFSSTSVSSSAPASTLTITASSSATLGNDEFTVTGTGGGLTLTATATATVTVTDIPILPPTTTGLSVSPASGDVAQGSSRDYTVTLSPAAGFTSSVALSVSGLGTGLSGSFSSTSVSSSAPASTLTITASSSATLGNDEFTVTGTGGGLTLTATATATVTVTVTPDFSLSVASPWSRDVWQGSSEDYTITLNRKGGFTGPVALSTFISGLDTSARGGVTASLSDDSLERSETDSTLTVSLTEAFSISDTFYIVIRGSNTDHDLTHHAVAGVTAKGFSLEISPSSREITQGTSGTYDLTLERVGSFTSSVALSVSGLGTGLTGSFSDDSLSSSETTSTLTITASSTAALGSDEFTITGTGGGLTRTTTVTATVTVPPDFSLWLEPAYHLVKRGGEGVKYTVELTRTGGFSGPVTLSVSGLGQGGPGGTLSDNSLEGLKTSSTLDVFASRRAIQQIAEFTVTGTGTTRTGRTLIKSVRGTAQVTRAVYSICAVKFTMVNHNRYAYTTDEECSDGGHSTPWGNWGVNSNVGIPVDGHQFQGWWPEDGWKQWNSCTDEYAAYRRVILPLPWFNYPSPLINYPKPANNYPSSDKFTWNDLAYDWESESGIHYYVDQISSTGEANEYGTITRYFKVDQPTDTDGNGSLDSGGCEELNGWTYSIGGNFMTVYELDRPFDGHDLIQSLYFPRVSVDLSCDVAGCHAVGDSLLNGKIDDIDNHASPAYVWPIKYVDDWGIQCTPSATSVPCKRIDATIRVGGVEGVYLDVLFENAFEMPD